MIALDTHALLWWALDPPQLSETARQVCAEMEERGGIASAVSIWELGTKVKRGKLDLGVGIDELARRIDSTGVVELVPVDAQVWLRSLALEWDHRDPADRVIVSTALLRGVPLLTKDATVHRYSGVRCIW